MLCNPVYAFGLAVRISNLYFISKQLQVNTGFSYAKLRFSYDPEEIYYYHEDDLLEYTNLKIPVQFSYSLLKTRFSPYLAAGITINSRFNYVESNHLNMNFVTRHYDYNLGISSVQLGYNGALGLRWSFMQKLSFRVECQYEYGRRFFGTYVADYSQLQTLVIQSSLLYQFN